MEGTRHQRGDSGPTLSVVEDKMTAELRMRHFAKLSGVLVSLLLLSSPWLGVSEWREPRESQARTVEACRAVVVGVVPRADQEEIMRQTMGFRLVGSWLVACMRGALGSSRIGRSETSAAAKAVVVCFEQVGGEECCPFGRHRAAATERNGKNEGNEDQTWAPQTGHRSERENKRETSCTHKSKTRVIDDGLETTSRRLKEEKGSDRQPRVVVFPPYTHSTYGVQAILNWGVKREPQRGKMQRA